MVKQRGLIWTATIFNVLIRNIQGEYHVEEVKSTCDLHDFEYQSHKFLMFAKRGVVYYISLSIMTQRDLSKNNDRGISFIFL